VRESLATSLGITCSWESLEFRDISLLCLGAFLVPSNHNNNPSRGCVNLVPRTRVVSLQSEPYAELRRRPAANRIQLTAKHSRCRSRTQNSLLGRSNPPEIAGCQANAASQDGLTMTPVEGDAMERPASTMANKAGGYGTYPLSTSLGFLKPSG
jgi:hypothetical protein